MKRAHIEIDPRDGRFHVYSLAPLRSHSTHLTLKEARDAAAELEKKWSA